MKMLLTVSNESYCWLTANNHWKSVWGGSWVISQDHSNQEAGMDPMPFELAAKVHSALGFVEGNEMIEVLPLTRKLLQWKPEKQKCQNRRRQKKR